MLGKLFKYDFKELGAFYLPVYLIYAGITAAFAARGIDEAAAAAAAVYVHGTAADIAKERFSIDSMLATDVIECIPEALKMITGA